MATGREEIQTVFCAVKYIFNEFLSLKQVGSIHATFWAKSVTCVMYLVSFSTGRVPDRVEDNRFPYVPRRLLMETPYPKQLLSER